MSSKVKDLHGSIGKNSSCSSDFIIGIDLGGTKVAGILLSPAGVILARQRKDVPASVDGKALSEILAELLEKLSSESRGTVDVVGIGVPGPLEENGRVLPPVPNFPKVGRLHLHEFLKGVIKCPVILENDANCFALGEATFGSGKEYEIVVGITLGTGLGVGIVVGGRIHRGCHWTAGEIWDLPLEDGYIFEDYLCGRYLVRQIDAVSAEEAAKLARAGEKRAMDAWHSFGERLVWLLDILGRIIDPDLFVLGGSLSCAYALFNSEIQQASLRWPVRVSIDSEEMAMLGAAVVAVQGRNYHGCNAQ